MSIKRSILVVEDEADLANMLRFNLDREGYVCRAVHDGVSALAEVKKNPPDLIILDRMIPGVSGDEVAGRLRQDPQTSRIPIIMLTAKADEADELVGFALGADDYITKPFSMKPLLARVAARLRRAERDETPRELVKSGPFTLDLSRHELTIDGEPVQLTVTEFRLLRTLMSANGRVLNRSQLIDAALGMDVAVTDRTIDVHITALRRKVGGTRMGVLPASWIQTVRGVGYTFRPPKP
jgi:DNA-binding response OmpR family regulator